MVIPPEMAAISKKLSATFASRQDIENATEELVKILARLYVPDPLPRGLARPRLEDKAASIWSSSRLTSRPASSSSRSSGNNACRRCGRRHAKGRTSCACRLSGLTASTAKRADPRTCVTELGYGVTAIIRSFGPNGRGAFPDRKRRGRQKASGSN